MDHRKDAQDRGDQCGREEVLMGSKSWLAGKNGMQGTATAAREGRVPQRGGKTRQGQRWHSDMMSNKTEMPDGLSVQTTHPSLPGSTQDFVSELHVHIYSLETCLCSPESQEWLQDHVYPNFCTENQREQSLTATQVCSGSGALFYKHQAMCVLSLCKWVSVYIFLCV